MERGNVILPDLIWQSREVSHAIKSGGKDIMNKEELIQALNDANIDFEIIKDHGDGMHIQVNYDDDEE
jgi:hypothetical protein